MSALGDDVVLDREKGELRILGTRYAALKAQSFCNNLDRLVGTKVASVIMNNLEVQLGKEDVERILETSPKATFDDVTKTLVATDLVTGMGVTKVMVEKETDSIFVETTNPCVRRVQGASKAFLFSWWAGAFSRLLGKPLEVREVNYDEERNFIKARIAPRG